MTELRGAVALLLFLIWWTAEIAALVGAVRARPPGVVAQRRDRGSFWVVIVAAFGSGFAADALWMAHVGPLLPLAALAVAVPVALTGVALRVWSIRTLGRFFSPVVQLQEGHRLVRAGPYRWLRHPSYTGILLAELGGVIALGNVAGVLLVLVALLAAFGYRIRVEERALLSAFGEEYLEVMRSTWRLIPGVY